MSWKKVNLFDTFNKLVYLEDVGFAVMPGIDSNCFEFVFDNKRLTACDLFIKNNDNYVRLDMAFEQVVGSKFSDELFICTSYVDKKYEKVVATSIILKIKVYLISSISNSLKELKKLSKVDFCREIKLDEVKNTLVYTSDEDVSEALEQVGVNGEVKDKVFLLGKGAGEIVSVEKNHYVISLKDGENIDADFSSDQLVKLPENCGEDRALFLERQFNAESLQLLSEKNTITGDIMFMWKAQPNKKYIFEVYKIAERDGKKNIYKLFENVIPCNEHYYQMDGEFIKKLGPNVIARVVSIDNASKAVFAFSKGLNVNAF